MQSTQETQLADSQRQDAQLPSEEEIEPNPSTTKGKDGKGKGSGKGGKGKDKKLPLRQQRLAAILDEPRDDVQIVPSLKSG